MSTSAPANSSSSGGLGRIAPYDRIKEAILKGTIEPGAALVESQVAEWCGVSRTPVREALTRLEQDGVISRGDRGLVVRDRSPEEVLDIYEVRIVLETTAARVAVERHTQFDRIRLEHLLRAAEQADRSDGDALALANREFHRGVWLASHNESLIDLLTRLNLHLMRYPATTLMHPGRWDASLEQHRAMVEAIVDRDVERAEHLARGHFVEARDIRIRLWEQDF